MAENNAANVEVRDLVVSRIFDASVQEVWRAWTDPEYVKQWWGPDGFTCPVARLDVREGASSLVAMSSADFGTHYSIWQYQEVRPEERIEYVHNLANESGSKVHPTELGMPGDFPEDVRNIVTFRAVDSNRTELTVTEQAPFTDQWRELSKTGLEQCLDKMGRIFSER